MIRPPEMQQAVPMKLANGALSTTADVWAVLEAAYRGDISTIQRLAARCRELLYAQYNYTPPIHFAVREGHEELVEYLLSNGAHDPAYKTYPFLDTLETVARDRGLTQIATLLEDYAQQPARHRYKGDNGEIMQERSDLQRECQVAVKDGKLKRVAQILEQHPGFATDDNFFWGEGILLMPAKHNDRAMMDLLMKYGARVPSVLKWAPAYYFERYEQAAYLMEKGMDPNTQSWHHVTVLHNMAQQGDTRKAALLLDHGADINAIEEEYQSTPLGVAARWGRKEMVEYLLSRGADVSLSGAEWSTPLAWAEAKGHGEVVALLSGRRSGLL